MNENENHEIGVEKSTLEQEYQTVGQRLLTQRQLIGLKKEDIAQKLKLSLRQIDALEQDRYHELPGGIFIRGFVKSYAHLLGLDPEPLLIDLKALIKEQVPGKLPDLYATQKPISADYQERQKRSQHWLVGLILLLIICAIAIGVMRYLGLQAPSFEREEKEEVLSSVPLMTQEEKEPSASTVDTLVTPSEVRRTASIPSSKPSSTLGIVVASTVASNAPAENTLQIQTTEDSWLRVVDANGEVLLEGVVKPDRPKNLGGLPPYKVRVGNVAHTSLIYDGKKLDLTNAEAQNVATIEVGQGN